MRNLSLCITVAILAFVATAQPASNGERITIVDSISIAVPPPWQIAYRTKWLTELRVPPQKQRRADPLETRDPKLRRMPPADEARMIIGYETRRSHAEAVVRLAEIAASQRVAVKTLVIAGWPAIERIYTAPAPEPGESEARDRKTGAIITTFAQTAIAIQETVVRFDTTFQPDTDRRLAEDALAIARATRAPEGNPDAAASELREVDAAMARVPRAAPQPAPEVGAPKVPPSSGPKGHGAGGVAVQARTGVGELEVAASADGQHVVVATNTGFSFSDNFGATFTGGGATPCIYGLGNCDGDPSLAIGHSGRFYYAWIGFPTGVAGHADGVTNSLSVSTDTTGHTYSFVSDSVNCPAGVVGGCTLPDQEHIASDRFHDSGSAQDRVYVAYRHFTSGSVRHVRIVCSSDSGATWPNSFDIAGTTDFPRPSVAPDGMVYVAYTDGTNMMLHKFSDCDAGFTPQAGFPVTVSAFTAVPCPITGLDRCGAQNTMESPRVAADELDANHIYYAFANNTSASNNDVIVLDSTTGGSMGSWTRSIVVNNAVAAIRFMPWLSVSGSTAVVDWYDRRTATSATLDDRTRFMGGSVRVSGTSLVRGAEIDFMGVDDRQCIGWPCGAGTRTVASSENCPTQPQLAGVCWSPITGNASSFSACDFSSTVCAVAGETCFTDRGCPKYGDYNGIWAIAARRFSAWASGTAPSGVAGAPAGINVYESADNIPSEFYVRDWTNTATDFDTGTTPSTIPWFWATSDVWNQNTATPPASIPTWFAGDAPVRGGTNVAFARVSRRMTAPFAENVNAHFLSGDYGAGNPFVDIGDAPANFAAGDMTALAHIPWTVDATASTHLCLAVEIDATDDHIIAPSISGLFVGGTTDDRIKEDNNKAQRNLQETTGDGTAGVEMHAMITNNMKESKLWALGIHWPPDVSGIVEVVGSDVRKQIRGGEDTTLTLGRFARREVRALRVRLDKFTAGARLDFADVSRDAKEPANGFSYLLQRRPLDEVFASYSRDYASVLMRLAAIDQSSTAKKEAELAAARAGKGDPRETSKFLRSRLSSLRTIVKRHLAEGKDPFGLAAALNQLDSATKSGDAKTVAIAQRAFTERLDAELTIRQRTR